LTFHFLTDLLLANPNVSYLAKQNTEAAGDDITVRDFNEVLMGDCLIIGSQILVSIQMVFEEKYTKKYQIPVLHAVGLEGIFGLLVMSTLLIPMYFINVGEKFGKNPRHVLEDALDGFYQLGHNGLLLATYIATFTSIAIYYYVGMSITKEANATTRVVLDSIRILIIWGIAIAAGIISLTTLCLQKKNYNPRCLCSSKRLYVW
jgi:hypothetical protein